MDATYTTWIKRLRVQAKTYRRLAVGTLPWDVAEQLEEWASECDREAAQLASERRRLVPAIRGMDGIAGVPRPLKGH